MKRYALLVLLLGCSPPVSKSALYAAPPPENGAVEADAGADAADLADVGAPPEDGAVEADAGADAQPTVIYYMETGCQCELTRRAYYNVIGGNAVCGLFTSVPWSTPHCWMYYPAINANDIFYCCQ